MSANLRHRSIVMNSINWAPRKPFTMLASLLVIQSALLAILLIPSKILCQENTDISSNHLKDLDNNNTQLKQLNSKLDQLIDSTTAKLIATSGPKLTSDGLQGEPAVGDGEARQAAEASQMEGNPAPSYGTDNADENSDGSDLNFSLMNAPHDRIQAVKNLLSAHRTSLGSNNNSYSYNLSRQPSVFSPPEMKQDQQVGGGGGGEPAGQLQCTHKGRQFANGQQVPIEEQPCLNCTCRGAILQCFLRVCPPIISLEAHKRMQQLATMESKGVPQRCRMIKEANQCCPSMKCEPDVSEVSRRNTTTTIALNLDSLPPGQMLTVAPARVESPQFSDANTVSLSANRLNAPNELMSVSNRSVSSEQPAPQAAIHSDPLTSSSTHEDQYQLPKLTVISGGSGQRDSILLITSNPNVNGVKEKHLTGLNVAHFGNESSTHSDKTSGYSNALLDALLEHVYSSAAQLNGLNVQGSCMVNGSLYVEGSAVIPEASAYCQYCYCIRQKVMCIKPKCHLSISGCTAKYSNEYACCPTSYTCSNPETASGTSSLYSPPGRLNGALHSSTGITSKLSAAIEQLTRMSSLDQTGSPASARQVDRALNQPEVANSNGEDSIAGTMMALINSLAADMGTAANETSAVSNSTTKSNSTIVSTTTPTPTPTTSTTSSTTSTSTSTTSPSPTITSEPPPASEDEEEADEEEAAEADKKKSEEVEIKTEKANESNGAEAEKEPEKQEARGRKKSGKRKNKDQARNGTDKPSGDGPVSDFLEPMKKLGPLVVSPSSPSGCVENGRQYAIGEQIPTLESCKHCYCGIDGVKDCRMVECQLKMAHVHNCKPVTLPGHCCPMRYECPPSGRPNHNAQASQQQRYRSDKSAEQTSTGNQFIQCKLGVDCANFDSSIIGGGNLENQTGKLLIDNGEIPSFNTTRVVDNTQGQLAGGSDSNGLQLSSPIVNHYRQQQERDLFSGLTRGALSSSNETSMSGLTEELNKFIMQINHQNISTQGTDYSVLNNNSQNAIVEPKYQPADYHTVLAPTTTNQPPLPPSGMMGIPSIQPEPLQNLMQDLRIRSPESFESTTAGSPPPAMSSVEYLNGGPQSMRDSRSSGEPNIYIDNHREPVEGPTYNNRPVRAEVSSLLDDYMDIPTNDMGHRGMPMNNSEVPHIRIMRNHHNNNNNHSRFRMEPNFNTTPPNALLVEFDDDNSTRNIPLANNDLFPVPGRPLIPVVNMQAQNLNKLLNVHNNSIIDLGDDSSTPSPPGQPTTGTPIGLDADRTPETNGWLRSLSGMVSSFGKRLVGSEGLQGAASNGERGFQFDGENNSQAITSGRSSKQNSILNQLLENMMGGLREQPQVDNSSNLQQSPLVMRPLGGVLQVEGERPLAVNRQQFLPQDGETFKVPKTPYETTAASTNTVEIVTAAMPAEPEVFGQEPGRMIFAAPPIHQQFSRRSDIGSNPDELLSEVSSSMSAVDALGGSSNNQQTNVNNQNNLGVIIGRRIPKSQAKVGNLNGKSPSSCFDLATNKTYQQNEIIPKDDPCKTCTCLLGEELCQNLVCPEKPGDHCQEERKAGQCCANYLCGSKMSPLEIRQFSGSHEASRVAPEVPAPPNARLLAVLNNQMDRFLPQQQQTFNSQPALVTNSRGRSVQGDSLNMRTQGPVRTADLANILPPHLRFRPNSNGAQPINQLQARGMSFQNHLGSLDPSNVLFSGPANQRFITHQTTNNNNRQTFPSNNIVLDRRNDITSQSQNLGNRFGVIDQHQQQRGIGSNAIVPIPTILAHPQRLANFNYHQSNLPAGNSFNRRVATNGKDPDEHQGGGWKQGEHQNRMHLSNIVPAGAAQQSVSPMASQNILTNRVRPIPSSGLEVSSSPDLNKVNWQPNLIGTSQSQNNFGSSIIPMLPKVSDAFPSTNTLVSSSSKQDINDKPVEEPKPDRVLFQSSPVTQTTSTIDSNQLYPNMNSVDTGFRPIAQPGTFVTSKVPFPVHNDELPEIVTPTTEAPVELSSSPTDHLGPVEPNPTTTAASYINRDELPIESGDESTRKLESSSTMESLSKVSETSPTSVREEPSTEAATTTKEIPQEPTSGSSSSDEQTGTFAPDSTTTTRPEATSTDTDSDTNTSNSFDPSDMFRVSECNIYGKIFRVGQTIPDLSDVCKQCTCTSMGVDCQTRC